MLPPDLLAVKTSAAPVLPLGKVRLILCSFSQTFNVAHSLQSMSKPKQICQKLMLYSPAIWQQSLQTFVNVSVKPIANGDVSIGVAQVHEPHFERFDGIKLRHCRVGFS